MVLTSKLLSFTKEDLQTDLKDRFTHGAVGTASITPIASDLTLSGEVFRDVIDDFDTGIPGKIVASIEIGTTEVNGETIRGTAWFSTGAAGTALSINSLAAVVKTNAISLFLDTTIDLTVLEI